MSKFTSMLLMPMSLSLFMLSLLLMFMSSFLFMLLVYSEAKKHILKRKEGETHVVTYQGKAYNLFYPPQNYGYQSYNQYDGNAAQSNYQSNSKPVARFPTLPPPVQVVTSQPMGQSNNNVRRARP